MKSKNLWLLVISLLMGSFVFGQSPRTRSSVLPGTLRQQELVVKPGAEIVLEGELIKYTLVDSLCFENPYMKEFLTVWMVPEEGIVPSSIFLIDQHQREVGCFEVIDYIVPFDGVFAIESEKKVIIRRVDLEEQGGVYEN